MFKFISESVENINFVESYMSRWLEPGRNSCRKSSTLQLGTSETVNTAASGIEIGVMVVSDCYFSLRHLSMSGLTELRS